MGGEKDVSAKGGSGANNGEGVRWTERAHWTERVCCIERCKERGCALYVSQARQDENRQAYSQLCLQFSAFSSLIPAVFHRFQVQP